jgi:hypothetical protein
MADHYLVTGITPEGDDYTQLFEAPTPMNALAQAKDKTIPGSVVFRLIIFIPAEMTTVYSAGSMEMSLETVERNDG